MSEKDPQLYDLTRRKVLGGLTAVGLASAGAGLGTSAYFSDEETFKQNRLVAGSLDLKVDWEEHYSDWSDDEAVTYTDGNGQEQPGVMMDAPSDLADWVGVPDPQNPMVYVHQDALREFREQTAIEAYPDRQDDGWQDRVWLNQDGTDPCEVLADIPSGLESDYRTEGNVNGQNTAPGDPLVNLGDVKPGDFGELTLSYHLCDNPGYVWATGQLVSASENGVIEPEAADPDEEDGVVELLDTVETALWYDDGDNVLEEGGTQGGQIDVVITLDESGSISSSELTSIRSAAETFVDLLGASDQSASVAFATNATLRQGLTTDKSVVKSAINQSRLTGNTNMQAAINTAQGELDANGRSGADQLILLLGDGQPTARNSDPSDTPIDLSSDNIEAALEAADDAKGDGTRIISLGFGLSTGGTGENVMKSVAGQTDNSESTYANSVYDDEGDYFLAPAQSDLEQAFQDIGEEIITGEEVIFRGTLRETLNLLSGKKVNGDDVPYQTPGIALDAGDEFDEVVGGPKRPAPGGAETRQCFGPSSSHYLGFAWWVPVNHGNEIQTDSATFDIGFYTEQCRHNDGGGQNSLVPTRRGDGFVKLPENANFNGDGSISSGARARSGDLDGPQTWELAVGDEPGASGEFTQAQYTWSDGATVDWSVAYHAGSDELTFEFDGNSISYTLDDQPDGRVGIQAKADEATVEVDDVAMVVDGQSVALSGPNSVTAENADVGNDDGRDIQYLVINSALDGETNFTVSGRATVTLGEDFKGGEEDVAVDIVLE